MRVSDLNIDRVYVNSITRPQDYQMVENHFHYYYELFYVRQGGARFFINNSLYDLHAGDYIIIPPREVHFNRYLSQCTRINIYFNQSDLLKDGEMFLPGIEARFLHQCVAHVPSAYRENLEANIDMMLQEEKIDDESTKEALELLLKRFFILSSRYCTFRTSAAATSSEDDSVLNAAQYIADHFNQPITLDDLAGMASLSPSYFSKKFRQTTGMGMKEYLSYVRLKHASQELLSTRHSVTEVAINCGFNDSNYFKDAFKKMYGLSPRAYRNSKNTDSITAESVANYYNKKAQRGPVL